MARQVRGRLEVRTPTVYNLTYSLATGGRKADEMDVTKLLFRAGRELAEGNAERALRTARQAKRRANRRGQGRLEYQADLLLAAMRRGGLTPPVEEEAAPGLWARLRGLFR